MKHDWALVVVAALVCVASAWATFFLYAKAPGPLFRRRLIWVAMTGVVAGSGIWTTHFVAMLAFRTGLPTGYVAAPTLGSLAIAVLGTSLGFAIALGGSQTRRSGLTAAAGGLIVGLSIALMHYVGMLGYRTAGQITWDSAYVVASVLIGAALSAAALLVAKPGAGVGRQIAAGALLAAGIVGTHFTGMTAVTIVPELRPLGPEHLLSGAVLASIAVAVTALILVTAVAGVALEAASRYGHLTRLREALDAMPDGIAFFGPDDRLVAWNAKYADLCASRGRAAAVGVLFDDMLTRGLEVGAFPDAIGREEAWLDERRAARAGDAGSLIQSTADGRWLRVSERRTADGGIVSNCVDITELKRAEAAMAQARDAAEEHARRADVAEAIAGLGHWRVDAASLEMTCSDQVYAIYGFQPGAALDIDAAMALSHPDDVAEGRERIARQLSQGTSEQIDSRIVRSDGETRYIEGASRAERDADGRIRAIVGTILDVTDRRRSERALAASEERFRRLADTAPSIIAECGLDGVMTYVSPACLTLTGFTQQELVGRPFASLMNPEDAEKVLAMCRAVFDSRGKIAPWTVEFRARHKSGQSIWMECKPTLVADASGRFVGLTDVISDITGRKSLEAELRAAQAEAEAAAAVKTEFLANMSHELRTPLTSIIGFTGLAADRPELSELTRDYVERVREASRALLCTVNDILDFSKLEAGQVTISPEPVSLAKLARATLDLFTPQAGAKDVQLRFDDSGCPPDLVVAVDPDRIRQLLLNLVSNAVKFTDGGSVTLRLGYDASDEMLSVDVIDTGAGIAPDKQALLFQRFSQVDGSLTRAQGGTGLGLAICKGLVEAMGGEIGVESREGEGSRFWFNTYAPPVEATQTSGDVDHSSPVDFVGLRVLVVDDHAANRDLARLFLAGLGAEVSEAVDGEEAARLAAEWPYDVILMDLRMPRLDGAGALRRIRGGAGPNDTTPILAFTADADPTMAHRLAELGFQEVVAKPLDPGALIAAVGRATTYAASTDVRAWSDVA